MIQLRRHGGGEEESGSGPRFRPGDIVFHKRYRYRGVVVDADEFCQADEDWYRTNLTQPTREQGWYHVLPHGLPHTKYVAEENLMLDPTGEPIAHPLLARFFSGYAGGAYVRNDVPWGP